ncbi:shikimate dehydrogenase [Bifidobacterium pullorum subsp. saeculare]|uniref:Shikimate dehydrogenase n=1 Tax=Bifidobacterium pullorum subsp. saeculare TaxID=78257 RepID=A0A938WWR7_9BIFI|nr:shikimate dehydrogenase [Bifidobacterium pullorum]MBM6699331.1 shikimate dehydrogenase [Bifidobacterium pullorum subsp. saeculare]
MPTIDHRCAVLGKPIAHSLSPVLHNAAYRALGLEGWSYGRHEVGEEDLAPFLRSLDPTWAGLSLTMPLKRTIQPYGERCDRWSRELGISNTAVLDWDASDAAEGLPRIRLYNTDVAGIAMAYGEATRHDDPTRAGRGAVVIGNGNTATSAVAACTTIPGIDRITVAARHPGRNTALAGLAARGFGHADAYAEIGLDDTDALLAALGDAAFVVSTIPGHAGDAVADRLAGADGHTARIRPRGLLLDVVYDPRPTRLMEAWRAAGGQAIGGETMLLGQAIPQVLLMTGAWDGETAGGVPDAGTGPMAQAMRAALEEAL